MQLCINQITLRLFLLPSWAKTTQLVLVLSFLIS